MASGFACLELGQYSVSLFAVFGRAYVDIERYFGCFDGTVAGAGTVAGIGPFSACLCINN